LAKATLTPQELTHVQIADRAFEIYVARGGYHGHDVGDWFEAERQLLSELQRKPIVKQMTSPRRGAATRRGSSSSVVRLKTE